MLRPDSAIERVYLHRAPIDMRKQMDGLSMLVKQAMQMDPLSGALFVFINKSRTKLKLLVTMYPSVEYTSPVVGPSAMTKPEPSVS